MKIISTNIANPRTIIWKGREVQTGLYKQPVESGIYLEYGDVRHDHVIDRKYHGGKDKACYLYSADHYEFWKEYYPDLDWQWGMFGENLTVSGLDESEIRIGDIFHAGEAIIQATQPRQPCFKLGIRFGTQEILKQFSLSDFPGIYVRVLRKGHLKKGDSIQVVETFQGSPSVKTVFNMLYRSDFEKKQVAEAVRNSYLAASCRRDLLKRWNLIEKNPSR